MNYFELYPGDYLRDTTRLTMLEHGAYLRLLLAYYAEEKPLPSDETELFLVVGAMTPADRAAARKICKRFFPLGDDGLRRNARADAEIEKAQRRIQAARKNGAKNQAKKHPAGYPLDMPVGDPAGTQPLTHAGEALHTPPNQNQERAPASPPAVDFRADLFRRWKALGEASGGGAFLNKLFRDHKPEQRVMEALERTLDETRADPKAFVLGVLNAASRAESAHDELMRGVV